MSVPLNIALRQKVALLLVVSLSSLEIIAAIVRLLKVMQFNVSLDRTCKSQFTTRQNELDLLIMLQGTLRTSPLGVPWRLTLDSSVPPPPPSNP